MQTRSDRRRSGHRDSVKAKSWRQESAATETDRAFGLFWSQAAWSVCADRSQALYSIRCWRPPFGKFPSSGKSTYCPPQSVGEAGMSWQATAWAIRQPTGAARRKLLLLALANYADKDGICWPSQVTLARVTEQSVDTVQRQLDVLVVLKILQRERMPKRRGQWQGYRYKLPLHADWVQQNVTSSLRSGQAAISMPTRPQSLRLKPSVEPSYEPSHTNAISDSVERLRAFQGKLEGVEVVQNRIARRIGGDGWLILGEMNDAQRSRLSTLEQQGRLDDETLQTAVLAIRIVRSP
jgi:hypothetical protein